MHRRVWAAIVIAAAVVVFGAAGYVIEHRDTVAHAGESPGYSAARSSAPTGSGPAPQPGNSTPPGNSAQQGNSAQPGGTAAHGDKPVVAFLGDDYTSGDGASSKDKRFSTLVSEQLGVTEKNFGISGAGYARPAHGLTYADRIGAIVAAHPAVVIVSGGRNDVPDNMSTLADDAHSLFATLHEKLPDAVLVAIAPWWGDSDHPRPLGTVSDAIRSAVQDADGHYLALPDPLHGHPGWMADAADPNDTGYAHLADSVASALAPLIPGTAR